MVKRIEEEDWARSHHQSPDMRPIELPDTSRQCLYISLYDDID